ncbi:unnamed protein product [Ceratitis capitata]|uniref:(Mediterranean fruit fly) hypothetical protein n=1 Tax=Ceratitis capitata TaxID=7213 RepID=A0A811U2Q9_CERCA|nr:unnamed protein product [Ceratitis capitata]
MATRSAVPLAPTADTRNCLQCRLCHRYHALRNCAAFRAMRPPQRIAVANAQGYCSNCLALTHVTEECDSRGKCRRCKKAHHTMLHPPELQYSESATATAPAAINKKAKKKQQQRQRATQQLAAQQRAIQQRAAQQRAAQQRAAQQRAAQQRAAQQRAAPQRATRKGTDKRLRSIAHTTTGLQTKAFRNRTSKGAIGEAIRALQKLQNALERIPAGRAGCLSAHH